MGSNEWQHPCGELVQLTAYADILKTAATHGRSKVVRYIVKWNTRDTILLCKCSAGPILLLMCYHEDVSLTSREMKSSRCFKIWHRSLQMFCCFTLPACDHYLCWFCFWLPRSVIIFKQLPNSLDWTQKMIVWLCFIHPKYTCTITHGQTSWTLCRGTTLSGL